MDSTCDRVKEGGGGSGEKNLKATAFSRILSSEKNIQQKISHSRQLYIKVHSDNDLFPVKKLSLDTFKITEDMFVETQH